MTKENRKKIEKGLGIYYIVRKTIEKTLAFSHEVRTFLKKPATFFVSALVINILNLCYIYDFFQERFSFAPSSALQVLATIVESSATILAVFFALVLFLLERRSEMRRIFGRGEFFSACLTFSLSIIFGLHNMITIEPDKRVDGTAIFLPAYLLIASLVLLSIFFYRLLKETKDYG